jgi:DnaJ family protein C protein 9
MHLIQQAFGESVNLYTDVLKCSKDADKAALRKAYYRAALKYHPDKRPKDDTEAARVFQAVSAAYEILSNDDLRASYDETGIIPNDDDHHDDDVNMESVQQWKEYFSAIFGKVTQSGIEAFAVKYKCSDEERRDVLKEYEKQKGNLLRMLEFVMLSEPRDAIRWVEDYLRPAIAAGEIRSQYEKTMEQTLRKCQAKAEKENQQQTNKQTKKKKETIINKDDEETETEEDSDEDEQAEEEEEEEEDVPKIRKKRSQPPPTKKPSISKKKGKSDLDGASAADDLIAKIRNKQQRATSNNNFMANLGARYGVKMADHQDDPLNDEEFAKIQSKLKNKKKRT